MICIYCGNHHKKDVTPDPIAFNSTLGYQWLLESLHFDGSEAVGPSSEGSEFNRGQNTPKEKISLSELLDLQITWSDEPEEPETIVTNKSLEQSKSTLNLSAVELDIFFSGSEKDTAVNASEDQPAISNQIQITSKAFVDPENLSLFQGAPPSETGVQSSIYASGDAFTGWEADFQSAVAGNQHEDSKSVEPFVDSTVDLSAHLDSVFGRTDDSNNEKLNSDSAPHPSDVCDWVQDDQMNYVISSASQQAELFDSVVEAKDGVSSDNLDKQSSKIVDDDWFQDTKWQNTTATSMTINEDDDLFGGRTKNNAASPPHLVKDWIQDDLLNNINSSVSQEDKQFKLAVKANDGMSSDYINNPSSESVDVDWFQDTKWQENSASIMTVNKDDDIVGGRPKNDAVPPPLVNDWIQHDLLNNISSSDSQQAEQFELPIEAKDGMSSDNIHEPSSESVDWFQDNLWQVNTACSKDRMVKEEDDSFDEWNDFASSTGNQDSFKRYRNQSGNEITASSEPMPGMSLLMSNDNYQGVDISSFSQSELFSGSTSNEIGIGEVKNIQPEVSTTNRTADAKAGESSEQPEKNADVSIETHRKDDAEMLMSQMHELSFMLESSLSVPSKPDGLSSFLHD